MTDNPRSKTVLEGSLVRTGAARLAFREGFAKVLTRGDLVALLKRLQSEAGLPLSQRQPVEMHPERTGEVIAVDPVAYCGYARGLCRQGCLLDWYWRKFLAASVAVIGTDIDAFNFIDWWDHTELAKAKLLLASEIEAILGVFQ